VGKYPSSIGQSDAQRRRTVGNDGVKIRVPGGPLGGIEIADRHNHGCGVVDAIDGGKTDAESAVNVLERPAHRAFHSQHAGAVVAVPVGKIPRLSRSRGDVDPGVIGIRIAGSRRRCGGGKRGRTDGHASAFGDHWRDAARCSRAADYDSGRARQGGGITGGRRIRVYLSGNIGGHRRVQQINAGTNRDAAD